MGFATCQILGVFAILLSDVLFEPLEGFLKSLTFATDFADLLGGFGISCAHHEMRTFGARLLISTIIPIVLILGIAVVFLFRARFTHPTRVRALRHAHTTFALLVLYVTLPSTSIMIFKTFVRDSRPLGINGEKYLIADYGGKSKKIVARWIFPSSALQTIIQTASDPTRSQHGEHRIYSVSDAMGYRLYRYLPHGYQRIVRCATVVESCDDSGGKRP